jgi:hypothetical protein
LAALIAVRIRITVVAARKPAVLLVYYTYMQQTLRIVEAIASRSSREADCQDRKADQTNCFLNC